MAKLTSKKRNALPTKSFAEPSKRAYPIHDAAHARNALARVSQFGSESEKAQVRAAVHKKFPKIGKHQAAADSHNNKADMHRAQADVHSAHVRMLETKLAGRRI